jgi:NADPH2:quinone reductase
VRAVVCRELGPPEILSVEEAPDPVAGPGSVLIAVEAAGVNFVDALFVSGQYQIRPTLPFTPGSEVAGRVLSLGEGAQGFADGDRVLASIGLGGFATAVTALPGQVSIIPASLDFARAATFTQSYCTALFALRHRARLAAGERVLVLGAGGGVGLAAIDVARWLGADVVAAASTESKRDAAIAAGATLAVDGSDGEVRFRDVTGWVDVVMDPVGGAQSLSALRALREGGRFVVIGFASGAIPQLPANQVLLRNREVIGVDWGAWAMAHASEQAVLLGELLDAVGRGSLRPLAPITYRLDDVASALNALLGRRVTGKVALVP